MAPLYCTIEQAIAAGATGDPGDILVRIEQAMGLIDDYTGTVWSRREAVVVTRSSPDGYSPLPWPVAEIFEVRPAGWPRPLSRTAYRYTSSLVTGDIDAVYLGGGRMYDPLIVGAEPWRGGYAGLVSRLGDERIHVRGEYGPEVTPLAVEQSCAALTAWLTAGGSLVPPDPSVAPVPNQVKTDDEGNVVSITVVDTTEQRPLARTTGLASVDAVLSAYVKPWIGVN